MQHIYKKIKCGVMGTLHRILAMCDSDTCVHCSIGFIPQKQQQQEIGIYSN